MYYPEEVVEEVRSKNDIVDVISSYVRLQKKGSSYFGLCPFHNEKTSSFSVTGHKQMYYCFGCGAGGNVFTFLMNYENYTFSEAIKELAGRAGITLPEVEQTEEMKQKSSRRTRMLEANKEAAKYFYYQLKTNQGKGGYDYLRKRELSDETIKSFGLGYSLKTSNDLYLYLKSKGFEDQLLKDVGLISFSEKIGTCDKFWNRVMFPIQDANHRVIGFGGRVMGEGEPKYLNSQETEVFDKGRNLYALNFARSVRKNNIILCEGYMDVIALHQSGFNQAVASLGTAFTSGQANLLRRYTENVYLSYDGDSAGTKASLRAIAILKEAGLTVKVINLKPYKDPDELIKAKGAEEYQKRMDNAENSFMFELRIMEGEYDLDDPEGKTKFHNEIAKKLCGFSEEIERENYIEAVASNYNIGFDNLRKLVKTYAQKTGLATPIDRPKSGIQKKQTASDMARKSQRALLTWIVDEPEIYNQIKKYIKSTDFVDELYYEVAKQLFESLEQNKMNPASIISHFQDEEQQREVALVFNTKIEQLETLSEKEKAIHDLVLTIKEQSYQQELANLGNDVTAITKAIEGKKALEELGKVHISLK